MRLGLLGVHLPEVPARGPLGTSGVQRRAARTVRLRRELPLQLQRAGVPMAGSSAPCHRRNSMKRKCEGCPVHFESTYARTKYCSPKCRGKHLAKRTRENRARGVPLKPKSKAWRKAVVASKARVVLATYNQFLRDRNSDFGCSLTLQQFSRLIFKPCHYCGEPPSIRTKSGTMLRSGIDRVSSSRGYFFGNCVSCCWRCNRMKWQWGVGEFLDHIRKIHQHSNR